MTTPAPPWALLAELTHACPLRCGYCSNPLELTRRSAELTTEHWARVFAEAARMGVLHTHLSGGEPLLRRDLDALVRAAVDAGLYTQLVTSGVGLSAARLDALTTSGLHSVQLSVQHSDPGQSDGLAGRDSWHDKRAAATRVKDRGLPLGLNVVLHRHNLDALPSILELAVSWGADRIELANTQFYGWGLLNRAALMPTRGQLIEAAATVARWRERTDVSLDITWVEPDYFTGTPKPCMGGWGNVSLTVTPDGTVLPCPAASSLPGLDAPNVRDQPLARIWNDSPAFNRYRGTAWMPQPCRSCDRRDADFGGCRCQAFALTGDASRTDPACALAPDHGLIGSLSADRADAPLVPRRPVGTGRPRRAGGQAPTPA
ncbi:pyrroloquinoline quinone biosynthesis protein PqqE [Streptomyces sp. Q6]|uniref:Pyrroloquinoline quinone biosynthesis protein PqqE n=1 Tax=Streptomyces citrinus TaxID=3118173 RepID=A0ACD5ANL9_9ACTN